MNQNQSHSTVLTTATESIYVLDHSIATAVDSLMIFCLRLFNALFVTFAAIIAIIVATNIGLQLMMVLF